MKKSHLLLQACLKFTLGAAAMALLLFVPAGTVQWPGAWLLCAVLFIPMFAVGLVLLTKAPTLLQKRLNNKETEPAQKWVIALSAIMFVGVFLLCGLDFRFGWSHLPAWLPWAAAGAFLVGYALYAEVMRENAYLSRTVEIQENQKVIDTGLYGIVRHPMYFATLLVFLPMPLILGSLWGFLVFALVYPAVIIPRILNEEQVLRAGLPGYTAYTQKVRWRLLPFLW